MNQGTILPMILLGILLLSLGVFFIIDKMKKNKEKNNNLRPNEKTTGKKGKKAPMTETEKQIMRSKELENTSKDDIFNFMAFDKIEDDMIISEKGDKHTMVIQCKGINYDLMSEIEQLAVEEGFITFLNTLRYPIQLYVQTRSVDLKATVELFKQRLDNIVASYEEINERYNTALNNMNFDSNELKKLEFEKNKQLNIMEYTQDITKYVEKMSLNKKMLQRKYYVLLSYYKSDINSTENFNETEIRDIAYRELYTRSQSIISALQTCSVSGKVLSSNELAELLYVSYNRDDAKLIDIKQALESGFYRLYSTSEDTFDKRRDLLLRTIQEDARAQAVLAIQQAVDDGTIETDDEFEKDYTEDVAAVAIQIINDSEADDSIKEQAKLIIAQNYMNKVNELQNTEESDQDNIQEIDENAPITDNQSNKNEENEEDKPIV